MPKLMTPDDQARMVLSIYNHFGARPDRVLLLKNFRAAAPKKNMGSADIRVGLEECITRGWVVQPVVGSFKLTDTGFGEM